MKTPSRIIGLDIARSLAIIGMIVLHMASLVWHTKVILNGLPAALFAILAGITLMIIARDFTVTTFLRIIARGCIITLIGLALLPVGGEVQVVLVVIGITMILVSWIPPLRWWWKLLLLVAATAAATIKYAPLTLPQVYPLLAYTAYFLAGMLFYEVYIRNSRVVAQWVSTGIAALIAAAGFYFRFTPDMPGWLRFTGHTGVLGGDYPVHRRRCHRPAPLPAYRPDSTQVGVSLCCVGSDVAKHLYPACAHRLLLAELRLPA